MANRKCNAEVKLRRDESQDRLIRRFIKKCKNERIVQECFDRKFYEKPSTKNKRKRHRRKVIARAIQKELGETK
jgi:ribosomal protein S21